MKNKELEIKKVETNEWGKSKATISNIILIILVASIVTILNYLYYKALWVF